MKSLGNCDWESNASFEKEICKDKHKLESAFSSAKIKWSQEEDIILDEITKDMKKPIKKWMGVEKEMAKIYLIKSISLRRTAKQCRERYLNHIEYKRKDWTTVEEQHMFTLNKELGNRWKEIANKLGRKDNDVKNQYYACYRKKFRKLRKEIKLVIRKLKLKISTHEFAKKLQNEVPYLDLNADAMIELINKVNESALEGPQEKVLPRNRVLTNSTPKITIHKNLLFQTCKSANCLIQNSVKDPEKPHIFNQVSNTNRLNEMNQQEAIHLQKEEVNQDQFRILQQICLTNEICKLYYLASFQISYNLFFQGD